MESSNKQPAKKRTRINGNRDRNDDVDDDIDDDIDDNDIDEIIDDVLDPISPSVLGRAGELAASYRCATPYPHGIIRDFCKSGFLGGVLAELKRHTKVKFKETDLFRVYQSIDLVSSAAISREKDR
jgi:hypothetical protein